MRVRTFLLAALLASMPIQALAECQTVTGWTTPLPLFARAGVEPAQGDVVYGYVRTLSGVPVPGAVVVATPLVKGHKGDRAVADARGRYALRHLKPGPVALTASKPKLGKIGPVPIRVLAEENDTPLPQRLDLGAMGAAIPAFRGDEAGGVLSSKLVQLPGLSRGLVADAAGGVSVLGMKAIQPLSLSGARPGIKFAGIERAVAWRPDHSRLYGISGFTGDGQLSAYSRSGQNIFCASLPFQPSDLAVGVDGNVWVVGARGGVGLAATLDPRGRVLHEMTLSPGSVLRVAVDRAGYGWLIDSEGGLVRMDPHGRVVSRLYLPAEPFAVYPTRDGGLWAVSSGIVTRLDQHLRPIAQIERGAPIQLAALDAQDRLWFLESGKLVVATTHGTRSYELKGMPIQGAADLALDQARRLWLLGLDRQRVAVARVP